MEEEKLDTNLQELIATPTLRWIFVGGKGGVGKTTTACSIACKLAETRNTVLIISTDPAHNISDAFGQKFYGSPSMVKGFSNLYAMETDVNFESNFQYTLGAEDGGLSQMLPEILSSLPGIDEAFSFAEMMNSVQTMNYSTIVFDTAPTGHTLRLLGFPDLIEKAFCKFSALKDRMSGALKMFGSMSQGMGADKQEDVFAKLDSLRAVTATVREYFADPTKTTFVCVCIPEFLSLYETERLVQELAKQNIDCSNIVVNQVFFPIGENIDLSSRPQILDAPLTAETVPTEVREYISRLENKHAAVSEAYEARRRMQSKYLLQIRDLYGMDFHVVCVPLRAEEVRGTKQLQQFSELLLEDRDLPLFVK